MHQPNATKNSAPEVTELRYQGSVGSVTFPELAEDLGYLAPLKLKFIGNTISGPQDIQATVTGDVVLITDMYAGIITISAIGLILNYILKRDSD